MHPSSRKCIYIPVRGEVRGVDVHDFLPIIDHPHFQRLRDVKQLGQVSLIYPAANHTRLEHSIGTLFELRMRTSSWPGQLTDDENRLLEAYALLHDIGHPAFSHATERVLGQDHKDIALVFLSDMKEVIEQCDIDFNRLEAMFCKKDPLETIISNHPLGVDKFDYLYRDSRFTCMDKPNIASLDGHIFWDSNRLVVDSSHGIIRTAQRLRELYISSYGECYLRKGAAAAQRVIEKMWQYILGSEITAKQAIRSTDTTAMSLFLNSKSDDCRNLAEAYRERVIPRAAVVFRMIDCAEDEVVNGKPIAVLEINKEIFSQWEDQYNHPDKLSQLEYTLEELTGLDPNNIIVAPQFHAYRYSERPIWIKRNNQFCQIDEIYREEALPAKALGRRYTAWRICVMDEEDRKKVCQMADQITSFLLDQ